jgi:hypothetical protein
MPIGTDTIAIPVGATATISENTAIATIPTLLRAHDLCPPRLLRRLEVVSSHSPVACALRITLVNLSIERFEVNKKPSYWH